MRDQENYRQTRRQESGRRASRRLEERQRGERRFAPRRHGPDQYGEPGPGGAQEDRSERRSEQPERRSEQPERRSEPRERRETLRERRSERRSELHERRLERHERHEHRRGRNFWAEWRDERHHHGHGEDIPVGQALSPQEMEAWREFFHQTFGTWPGEHWIFGGRRFSPWHQGIDSFNPFVATLLSKGGGLLPLYVLHLVALQPRYGNEIMELLAERTNGQWVSNPGAIYPLLNLLEKEGFIEGKWEDPDKRTIRIYTITPTGQDEVSRIKMIVMPKITETVQVLQQFIEDLQPAETAGETPDAEAETAPDTDPEDNPA